LGIPEAEVALNRTVPLGIIPRAGGAKVLPAGFYALLTADANPLVDNPSVGSPLFFHLQGRYRAGFEAGRVRALVTYLGLVIPAQDFLFHDDPGKGRGVSAAAIEIGADNLADPAPGAEGFIRQNDALGQSHLLPVGEGEDFQKVPDGHHTPEAESP